MDPDRLLPVPGVFLVAPPALIDPNFRRTVVLLCDHGSEGSFGLILNRPLTLHLHEVLDDIEPFPEPLALGGPVQPNTLHFLHRHPEVPEAVPVVDGIFWGGDFEAVRTLVQEGQAGPADMRFFLGYAGWSPEQLDTEIEQGGWFVAPAARGEIFSTNPDRLWRSVLRRMGGEYAVLANFPDDPRMN